MKNVLIIGDSYSTFEGYIPEGYECFYKKNEGDTDVRKVEETWWYQLLKEKGANLVLNNSWSGSPIGYVGWEGKDCKGNSSFIYRLDKLEKDGFFKQNQVDTVFIFGGTNDCWVNENYGELKFDGVTEEERYQVYPAFGHFFNRVSEVLKGKKVYCLINDGLKQGIIDTLAECASHYNIPYLKLQGVDKTLGHPTIKGMKQIKEQVLEFINKN